MFYQPKRGFCYQNDTITVMAMTLRLNAELEEKLNGIASELGCSKQKAIEVMIEAYDVRSKRKAELDEALEFVLSHDKKLMERLADA